MDPCPRALLTFGDSSGNPSRSIKGYRDAQYYVIVTATTDMHDAQRVDAQVQDLKEKYFGGISPERVSFHGQQLLHRLIRHTRNRPRAEQLFKEVFGGIIKIVQGMDATLNAVIMDKQFPTLNYKTSSTVIASWSQAPHVMRRTVLAPGHKTSAITILDMCDDPTNRLVSRAMARYMEPHIDHGRLDGVKTAPRPIFVNSESCNPVQLTDMVAYVAAKGHVDGAPEVPADLYSRPRPPMLHMVRITAE